MKRLFSKKTVAVIALSVFGLSLIPRIVPFGPKVPPVEFLQDSPNVENVIHIS
jgi:hypothetical protein